MVVQNLVVDQLAYFAVASLEIVRIVSLDFVEALPFGTVAVALLVSISVTSEALACFGP